MGEIITALIMVIISLGPLPKNKTLNNPEREFTSVTYKKKAYDPADLIWNQEPGLKKTTFNREGVTHTAFYDKHNDLIGTARHVEINVLPPIAINRLVMEFPGCQMGDIMEFTGLDKTYFVLLKKNQENFLVKVSSDSQVSYFRTLK